MPHKRCGQQRGQASHQDIQRQRSGIGEIEQQAPHRQAGNGGGGEKGQNTQGFGSTALDGPAGRAGEKQVLKMGQHHIQCGNDGAIDQTADFLVHKGTSFAK